MSGLKIGGIQLTDMDMYSLRDGEFLNDNVLNMYLLLLKEKCEQENVSAFIAGTHLFTKIRKGEGVSWYKKQSILCNDWVYIPVHYNTHWSVIVCCNLKSYLLEKTIPIIKRGSHQDKGTKAMVTLDQLSGNSNLQCRILSLDSLGKDYSKALSSLAKYIIDRWVFELLESGYTGASCINKDTLTKQFIRDLSITKARVPSQRNGYDCGGFMLHYIELLSHPTTVKVVELSNNLLFWAREGLRDWFSASDAEAKRPYIEELFCKLHSMQEAAGTNSNLVNALLSPRVVQGQVETALSKINKVWRRETKKLATTNEIVWDPGSDDDDTSGCSAFSESEDGDILPVRERYMTDEDIERSARMSELLMSKGASQGLLPPSKPRRKRAKKDTTTKQTTLTKFVTSPVGKIKRPKPDFDDPDTEGSSSDSSSSSGSSERKQKANPGPLQPKITSFCLKDRKSSSPQQKQLKPTGGRAAAKIAKSSSSEAKPKLHNLVTPEKSPCRPETDHKKPVAIIRKSITPPKIPKDAPPKVPLPKDAPPKVPLPKDAPPKIPLPKDAPPKVPVPKDAPPKIPLPKDAPPKVPPMELLVQLPNPKVPPKKAVPDEDKMTDCDESPRPRKEQRRAKKRDVERHESSFERRKQANFEDRHEHRRYGGYRNSYHRSDRNDRDRDYERDNRDRERDRNPYQTLSNLNDNGHRPKQQRQSNHSKHANHYDPHRRSFRDSRNDYDRYRHRR